MICLKINSKKFLRLLSSLVKLDDEFAFKMLFAFKLDENDDNTGFVVFTNELNLFSKEVTSEFVFEVIPPYLLSTDDIFCTIVLLVSFI